MTLRIHSNSLSSSMLWWRCSLRPANFVKTYATQSYFYETVKLIEILWLQHLIDRKSLYFLGQPFAKPLQFVRWCKKIYMPTDQATYLPYTCLPTYLHIPTYIPTYQSTYHIPTYIPTYLCVYVCVYVCMYEWMSVYVCMCVYVFVCMYIGYYTAFETAIKAAI